ncbi:MAG: tetratricopeptide repeat protein [Terracidiphilus sp.]|jgi:cytochrome c-type biogenesis protein CcmH/NrfG
MADTKRTPISHWTIKKALILSVVCLAAGIGGGWSIRGMQSQAVNGSANAGNVSGPANSASSPDSKVPSPARLTQMADAQAATLLDKLKSDPQNPDLLISIGNIYYDAQQYPAAIDYYGRALKVRPADASVRTDMGTAYWYMGNADTAISEFDKALSDAPDSPNTLFNRGLVRWKGKQDSAGAIADWEKLLAANPNYEGKSQVEQMMAEARGHSAAKPGLKAK